MIQNNSKWHYVLTLRDQDVARGVRGSISDVATAIQGELNGSATGTLLDDVLIHDCLKYGRSANVWLDWVLVIERVEPEAKNQR